MTTDFTENILFIESESSVIVQSITFVESTLKFLCDSTLADLGPERTLIQITNSLLSRRPDLPFFFFFTPLPRLTLLTPRLANK